MTRRWIAIGVSAWCGSLALACTLNPQPIPPEVGRTDNNPVPATSQVGDMDAAMPTRSGGSSSGGASGSSSSGGASGSSGSDGPRSIDGGSCCPPAALDASNGAPDGGGVLRVGDAAPGGDSGVDAEPPDAPPSTDATESSDHASQTAVDAAPDNVPDDRDSAEDLRRIEDRD